MLWNSLYKYLVPTAILELAQLSPLPPQDSVSTNSTTSACKERYSSTKLLSNFRARPAATAIYKLLLLAGRRSWLSGLFRGGRNYRHSRKDRKSTRLNSSH